MKSVFNATSSPSTISKPNSLNNSLAIYRVASAKLWCSKYPLENNSFKYLAFLERPNWFAKTSRTCANPSVEK